MKNLFFIASAIAVVGATTHPAGACSLGVPTFEATGFPISRLQVAVLGGAHVEESSATPELMSAGMPASPNQIALLTPHPKAMIVGALADPSQLTVGIARPRAQKSTAEMCAAD